MDKEECPSGDSGWLSCWIHYFWQERFRYKQKSSRLLHILFCIWTLYGVVDALTYVESDREQGNVWQVLSNSWICRDIKSDSIISPESQFNSEFAFLYFVYPFFAVGFWIYVVIATESTLSRNDVATESNAWSFGQTVAIILILLPIVDFLSVIKQLSQERTPESSSVTGEPGKESKCPRCLQELPTPASPWSASTTNLKSL